MVLEFTALFLALVALYVAIMTAMLLAWAILYGIVRIGLATWAYLTKVHYRGYINGKVRRRFRSGWARTSRPFRAKQTRSIHA